MKFLLALALLQVPTDREVLEELRRCHADLENLEACQESVARIQALADGWKRLHEESLERLRVDMARAEELHRREVEFERRYRAAWETYAGQMRAIAEKALTREYRPVWCLFLCKRKRTPDFNLPDVP